MLFLRHNVKSQFSANESNFATLSTFGVRKRKFSSKVKSARPSVTNGFAAKPSRDHVTFIVRALISSQTNLSHSSGRRRPCIDTTSAKFHSSSGSYLRNGVR